jgi:hypothetical protein
MLNERSPIPEKENEIYHIIVMEWWQRWKKYTGFDQITSEEESETTLECDNTTTIDSVADNFDNLQLHHKEPEEKKVYPGEINDEE